MTQDEQKQAAADAAIGEIEPGSVIGVGTGSTVDRFIDALGRMPERIAGAVSSSDVSSARLRSLGFPVLDANEVDRLAVYVDGADEIDGRGCMIKGGGAALTREKIVAEIADRFVCIADASKRSPVLGRVPLPVEVIPMATALVARQFRAIGGDPVLREGVTTDNGGWILDVHGLAFDDPVGLESAVNQWPGVVAVGLFARRGASVCWLATAAGVERLDYASPPSER